jgi:hypothetical protein
MSRNGSGTYILPVGNPVVTGTTISSNWANTTLSDISTALTGSIASDGQTPVTGNIQMGNNKITGMANGTASTDAATYGQLTAFVPAGAILMWSGSVASIPSGWLLCDGTNSTPDLRNRFIVGAGSTYAVNATGGSANAIVVSHTHTGTTDGQNTNHVHGAGGGGAFIVANGGSAAFNAGGSAGNQTNTDVANTDHNHPFTTGSTGSSGTNANLPPYLALAYIMKA